MVFSGALKGALAGAIVGIIVASALVIVDSVVWKTFDIFSGELPRDEAPIIGLRLGGGALNGILVGSVVGAVVGGSDISIRLSNIMLRASVSAAIAMSVGYLLSKAVLTLLSFALSNFPDVIASLGSLVQTLSVALAVIALGSTAIGLFVGIPSEYYAGRRRNVVKIILAAVIVGVVPIVASVTLGHMLFD